MTNSLRNWGKQTLNAGVLAGVMLSPAVQGNWQFDGTLIIPPVCQLGQQDPIRVPFGKVGVRKVDGTAFKKDVPYQLNCLGDMSQPWDVTLTFGGTLAGAGFDNATLRTVTPLNTGKLGIQIQKNGQPLELNKAFAIDVGTPPILSAVPVKRAGTDLVGDDFTATGTLTIAFQ
ncbi:TPA: fimbrial protein [Serratia fonticola]|uniref:fimbrial protein n=1 Tax=Serratia fonticola TaxID=47917 RepID=UPI002177CF7A|nr:fimbrial protein [Serratia fonticola]CAI1221981.1 putative minor fimbrial subunit StfF [Serratia fonticola]CAI2497207.1 putative minor fimbrial subunit StfF [Serratia fonticola]